MSEEVIFEHLFNVAKQSKDPRGVVSACLVNEGIILISTASADDGVRHAEDLLLEAIRNKKVQITPTSIIYCTLEPCNKRSRPEMKDCTTLLIESGIPTVVFGARDPGHSEVTLQRLIDARISVQQVENPAIIKRCADIYNSTVDTKGVGSDIELKPID